MWPDISDVEEAKATAQLLCLLPHILCSLALLLVYNSNPTDAFKNHPSKPASELILQLIFPSTKLHLGLSENVVYPIVPNGFADQTIPIKNG